MSYPVHHCETGSHSSPFTVNLQTEVETLKMATSAHGFPPSRHAYNKRGKEPMFGYKSGAFICGSGYRDLFTPCSNRTKTATTASAEICQGEMPSQPLSRGPSISAASRRHVATTHVNNQQTNTQFTAHLCISAVHSNICSVLQYVY